MKILQEAYVTVFNVNDETVLIVKKYFKDGDCVKAGSIAITIEYSKAIVDIEAEAEGHIQYYYDQGTDVPVNALLFRIYDEVPIEAEKRTAKIVATEGHVENIKFSKSASELMELNGIDREAFKGKELVTKQDVLNLLSKKNAGTDNTEQVVIQNMERIEIKKIGRSKSREIDYLSSVQFAGLNSAVSIYLDTRGLFERINRALRSIKNSILPVAIYEVSRLLLKYNEFNAYYVNGNIAYYRDINIGLAIDLGEGLKVVSIPKTPELGLSDIENAIIGAGNKYIDNKLSIEDLTGSTFTISDLSAEGIESFLPLINKDQSAILGIASVDERMERCVLTLAFDHRVSEGKKAAEFLYELKERIESYRTDNSELQSLARDQWIKRIKCYSCLKSLSEDESMAGVGFVKIINHDGYEGYICRPCLDGWK